MKKFSISMLALASVVGFAGVAEAAPTTVSYGTANVGVTSKAYVDKRDETNLATAKSYTDTSIAALDANVASDATADLAIKVDEVDGKLTAVSSAAINAGAVTTAKLADGAVINAKITDATIAAGKIDGSSNKGKILKSNATSGVVEWVDEFTYTLNDGDVTTAKIADANVTVDKLAADSVTTVKIKDANVTADKLATDSVTTAKIADANVTTAKIADDAVTAAKLADNAVDNSAIVDESITPNKLKAQCKAGQMLINVADAQGNMTFECVEIVTYDSTGYHLYSGGTASTKYNDSAVFTNGTGNM